MEFLEKILPFSLPVVDPIINFTIILGIFFITPHISKRSRLPGIIIIIVAGVLIGPHGLGIIDNTEWLDVVSTIGLLYLMFITGLEIDIKDFKVNRISSLTFGILSFIIPFVIGYVISISYLKLNVFGSVLVAAMLASHTLVAYPIVSRFGITRTQVVTILIGGTILADTLALLTLAVTEAMYLGEMSVLFWLKLIGQLGAFTLIVLILLPKISRWYYSKYEGDGSTQYTYVLLVIFFAASAAEIFHIEPIIGAFFAGLALNKLIIRTSPLMNRIHFIGETIFIPFFLLSVGMLVNLKVLTNSILSVVFASVLIIGAFLGKYIAAWITQLIFKLTGEQRQLMFGLSNARAASAIAIMLIGHELGIINELTLNITVVLILVSSFFSSITTQRASKKIAISEENKKADANKIPERILVPIANPQNIEQLINFSLLIKDHDAETPIYPLSIVPDDESSHEKILENEKYLEKAKSHASSTGTQLELVSRIDLNVSDGIVRAIKEIMITKIIMGWNDKKTSNKFFFSTILDNILKKTAKSIFVIKIRQAVSVSNRIVVVAPPSAEFEYGFEGWVKTLKQLSKNINADIIFYGMEKTIDKAGKILNGNSQKDGTKYRRCYSANILPIIANEIKKKDLLFIIKARERSVSYNKHISEIPNQLSDLYSDNNIVIVYPEQESPEVDYNE